MEVDKHREMRCYNCGEMRCYNCGETGYPTARCSKLRKERKEEVRIIENVMEDFSLGRK